MRIVPHVTFALIVSMGQGCSDNTAASTTAAQCPAGQHPLSVGCAWDPVAIAIGPVDDASGCPQFSPNPASAHENQLVKWTNDTAAALTVYEFEGTNSGVPSKLLATLAPGQTSTGDFWSTAGTVTVFTTGCSASSGGSIAIAGGSGGSSSGGGGGCQSGSYCYQWNCNGDSECLSTNPNGTSTGANDEGNDPSCSGLLMFGQQFWNIPPATQSCTLTP
jgi:hypothetical protein